MSITLNNLYLNRKENQRDFYNYIQFLYFHIISPLFSSQKADKMQNLVQFSISNRLFKSSLLLN